PLRGGNEARFFAIEIDLRNLAERQVVRIFGDLVHAEARSGVVEEDVAGDFQRVRYSDRSVALFSPATEAASEEDRAATTIECRSRTDGAIGQTGHGHHRLEHGPRRVEALDGAVQFDFERIRGD